MGTIRNGARTFLNLMAKACKLSHFPGFRPALERILGTENYLTFFGLWDPLCIFVDSLVSTDNWFNQIDYVDESGDSEDLGPPA